jgi:hypothetical protein
MMVRHSRLSLVASLAVLLAGISACRRTAFVSIEVGSTAARLVFLISRAADQAVALPAINGLSVLTDGCAGSGVGRGKLVWRIWDRDDHHPVPNRVVYGVPPVGFNTTTGPISLTAGCYAAEVASPGYAATLSFRVLSDGTVMAETPIR